MATFGATFRKNGKILFYHLVTLFTSHRGTPLVLGGRGIESGHFTPAPGWRITFATDISLRSEIRWTMLVCTKDALSGIKTIWKQNRERYDYWGKFMHCLCMHCVYVRIYCQWILCVCTYISSMYIVCMCVYIVCMYVYCACLSVR